MTKPLAPVLTPHGRLLLAPVDDAPALPPDLSLRLQEAFARGSGHGLLQLGAGEVGTALPPVLGYWREFGARYVTAVCTLPDVGDRGGPVHIPSSCCCGGADAGEVGDQVEQVDKTGYGHFEVFPPGSLLRPWPRPRRTQQVVDTAPAGTYIVRHAPLETDIEKHRSHTRRCVLHGDPYGRR